MLRQSFAIFLIGTLLIPPGGFAAQGRRSSQAARRSHPNERAASPLSSIDGRDAAEEAASRLDLAPDPTRIEPLIPVSESAPQLELSVAMPSPLSVAMPPPLSAAMPSVVSRRALEQNEAN